jgi:hypothetical protein
MRPWVRCLLLLGGIGAGWYSIVVGGSWNGKPSLTVAESVNMLGLAALFWAGVLAIVAAFTYEETS